MLTSPSTLPRIVLPLNESTLACRMVAGAIRAKIEEILLAGGRSSRSSPAEAEAEALAWATSESLASGKGKNVGKGTLYMWYTKLSAEKEAAASAAGRSRDPHKKRALPAQEEAEVRGGAGAVDGGAGKKAKY